ncbi:hypothetical protein D3Y59_14050 [Hymenobacter oligotrophus]|uniref:Uncharacterized protein n=1 Tax=Hymenobacter oligotrophus TaxID=2319843 RepID=A0A3B7RAK1_9BACT|nr:hypothetical protein D3Y59_14050 [Hymenobacter oligotrophus]
MYCWGYVSGYRGPRPARIPVRFKRLRLTVYTQPDGRFHLNIPLDKALRVGHDEVSVNLPPYTKVSAGKNLFAPGPITLNLLCPEEVRHLRSAQQ